MAEGTAVGALAVRIGADQSDLIKGLREADKAIARTVAAAAKFGVAAATAGAAVLTLVNRIADSADQLGKLSQKVGVSVESLSALKHAAALSDVSIDQLATGLRMLNKNMADTQAGTGEAKDAFRALGLEVTDSEGKLKSTEEQLLELSDKFARMQDGAGKTALAMRIFGKAGADLIPFLNQGRAGIEELRKEAERLGIVISTQAAKDAEVYNDNITKLKGAVEGLAIQLAGPLVKALGDVTTAMLEAQTRGESFFSVMATGLQRMFTGDDAHKWNVEIVKATDNLLQAENALLAAKRAAESPNAKLFPEQAAASVKKYEEAVVKARAEVDRLMRIKPVLVPEAAPKAEGGTEEAPSLMVPDEKALKDAREAYLKLFEIEQEAVKLGEEFTAEQHKRRLEEEQKLFDERNRILIEAYEREQEEAIRQGQELIDIEREIQQGLLKEGYTHRQLNLASAKTFFGNMAVLMNTNSKKLFQIGKAAAIAETIINTYAAAMGAYKAMASIPYIGPALGIAAAAAAMAAGMAQVQNIRSAQVGGGGAVATFPASPITGQPTGTPGGEVGPAAPQQTTVIKLHGEVFGREQLRKLFEQLNEEGRDGGRLVLA